MNGHVTENEGAVCTRAASRAVGVRGLGAGRGLGLVLVLALFPTLTSGCRRQAPPKKEPRSGAAVRATDDLGEVIRLPRPARRIASLSPSNTEILFALGCGERVVLRDRQSSYPPRARKLPATSPFQLSPEHIAGFTPDLVMLSHADKTRVTALRRIGLAVATFDPRTMTGVFRNIRSIAALCGAEKRAEALIAAMGKKVARVVEAVAGKRRPRVFIETDGADPLKPWTAGPGSFVDQLLRMAGGDNIAADLTRPYGQISAETVVARNPEIILVMGVDASATRRGLDRYRGLAGWRELEAVKKSRVVDGIHADLLSRPGPRLADGLDALARAIHPGTLSP